MQPEISAALLQRVNDQAVRSLVTLKATDWSGLITSVRAANPGKPCIPQAILDEYAVVDAIPVYAGRLKNAFSDLFATAVVGYKLSNNLP
ncbi:hypothetical protein ABK046_47025, partial [Streptomyces caeruleatus]